MTDIKIKIERYADKENLKKLMRYLKNTFVNKSEIKELIDQSADGKPISLKLDLVRFVSTLPELDAAEEGVLYFVPTDTAGEYDLYAKEIVDGVAKFVKNSSLHISGDLDGFLLKADAEKKYISTASVTDDTITLSRPDGSTIIITVDNVAHAAKADKDGNGAVIADTYATKTELASKANTSDLSTVATSGDYNDLINAPNIHVNKDGSLYVERNTDGYFFKFTHTGWSSSISNAWGGMYFRTSDNKNVFGFAARQTSSEFITMAEKVTFGNNGYLRGYDTQGNSTVTLIINGGTAGQPDTQNITVNGTFVNGGNQKPYSANAYTIGTPDMPYKAMYAGAMYAGTFNTDSPSSNSGLLASKSNTGHSLMFGIGGTGVNRGIYDNKNKRWSVFLDNTDYIMTQCPTPPKGDSSNKLATTEWVQNELVKLRQNLHDLQELVASMAKEQEND